MSPRRPSSWSDSRVDNSVVRYRQLFAELVDEMVPKLKRSLVQGVLPSAKTLVAGHDESNAKAARFQRLPGLVAGEENVDDATSDPAAPETSPSALEIADALEVAGLSEESGAESFAEKFNAWCVDWHLGEPWQRAGALRALVSMTEGWGKTKGDKSPTTLDQWMWPTHPGPLRAPTPRGVDRSGHYWGGGGDEKGHHFSVRKLSSYGAPTRPHILYADACTSPA